MHSDADKVFATREEAEQACAQLNEAPPEYGYGAWSLGGPVDGRWYVHRWRGLMAEELGDADAYAESYRRAFEHIAMDHAFWQESDGIRFEEVRLEGEYPDTLIVLLFRTAAAKHPMADPSCIFGVRWPVWPAGEPDPSLAANDLMVSFIEFHGADPRAYRTRNGPCDPDAINWLNSDPRGDDAVSGP